MDPSSAGVYVMEAIANIGLSTPQLLSFLDNSFNYTIPTDIYGTIDAGNSVMAVINCDNGLHSVVIVGYDSQHDYIFYDPSSGSLKQEDKSHPITYTNYYEVQELIP